MTLERAALSFERHLRAENKRPSTVETYLRALERAGPMSWLSSDRDRSVPRRKREDRS